MSDMPEDKPVDRDYARARLAEIKAMLTRSPGEAVPVSDDVAHLAVQQPLLSSQPFEGSVEDLIAAFEAAAERDAEGIEYWSSRALMPLLGYGDYWRNFEIVVGRARVACFQSGYNDADHFADVHKMVEIGSGAERAIKDVRVTRYGAYLIAQNGDSRKKQVAFAQTYFAVQTRRQEIADEEISHLPTDAQRRVMLRDEMTKHHKNLVSAAKASGVTKGIDFAVFQNSGYKGLYGLDRVGIQRAKGLPGKANILDHMGSTELAANLFRTTQTEEKLRRDRVQGKENANTVHYQVGRQVRKAIQDIGGTMPERLEAEEDIGKLRRRLGKAIPPGELE
ncbi:DNA damage-inducible protein D [uncultured Massilia sp.]|uniref:DNA damage-inducible protein D n=1 Tax=uncultured Massilia sp. TaxID=169973 RepID=UPI0025866788|nr:DNA damage-inducible protein D [uncultured Massilia sp.]